MNRPVTLFLYSLTCSEQQFSRLDRLVGKDRTDIKLALIENAADVIEDSAGWVASIRDGLEQLGYQLNSVDLRKTQAGALREVLLSSDVIWVGGGHTYYLRWILQESGADKLIVELVNQGKVYAGWSAGGIVAGPTTRFFEAMGDDPNQAPEVVLEGLGLTTHVMVPHLDNADFAQGASLTLQLLKQAGFSPIGLQDNQVLILQADQQMII
jgi:dipeptidase E